ncbi:MAG TPA: aromatic amino acid transport family protein [Feifaniaceae bacterium]|nr:aromatic amino acid transport family protein [Feifaniaceae bacterium]
MNKKQLTVWEAACIITGYGVGGGILAMPYLAEKTSVVLALVILLAAFAASWLLHMMIAEIAKKCGEGAQIVSAFSRFLFRGKAKVPLTIVFFALMAVILVTNLAAYVAGSADVIVGMLPMVPPLIAKLVFYIAAASVVLFGLKAVGVSEKLAVTMIFVLIGLLAAASLFAPLKPLPVSQGTVREALAYYGMAMFSFSAFFSIPQAVEGLGGDVSKVKKAVFWGMANNFILIVVIVLCALVASDGVSEVAMTGWSRGIGAWAQVVGGLFTLLAMITTYWSISLALSDIVGEQLRLGRRLCWLIATLPSLILSLVNLGGFIDFLELAGGAIAIVVAVMVVPAYRNARREVEGTMLGRYGGAGFQILVVVAYVLMAVGSVM